MKGRLLYMNVIEFEWPQGAARLWLPSESFPMGARDDGGTPAFRGRKSTLPKYRRGIPAVADPAVIRRIERVVTGVDFGGEKSGVRYRLGAGKVSWNCDSVNRDQIGEIPISVAWKIGILPPYRRLQALKPVYPAWFRAFF